MVLVDCRCWHTISSLVNTQNLSLSHIPKNVRKQHVPNLSGISSLNWNSMVIPPFCRRCIFPLTWRGLYSSVPGGTHSHLITDPWNSPYLSFKGVSLNPLQFPPFCSYISTLNSSWDTTCLFLPVWSCSFTDVGLTSSGLIRGGNNLWLYVFNGHMTWAFVNQLTWGVCDLLQIITIIYIYML